LIDTVGRYSHLESGTVIAQAKDFIIINIQGLSVTFSFIEDAKTTQPTLTAEGGGQNLVLKFVNFNLGIGNSNTSPLPLGTLSNRKLYLNYAVYSFGTPAIMKLLHYTFLLGENV
jgi:uncharacterized protein DUF6864